MAIIQISKIQVRSGNLVDLPQLDEAEFGWASDNKRLFIGKTTPNENIEILTSYSNIDFSQLNGSYGNLNLTSPKTGQVFSFDGASNAWLNAGGNALDPANPTYWSSQPIHLGNVSNLKIGGGAIGYILETDGKGNLSWTPKGIISANIADATQTNPVVVTTEDDNFFTSGSKVTITDVDGMTELNGQIYYVQVQTANSFALYTDLGLSIPVDGTGYFAYTGNGRAVSSIGTGGSGAAAGGSSFSVQYNFGGVATGDANFIWNNSSQILSVTGTANINGNLNSNGNITASRLISNVSTGTAPLVVTSTTRVANLDVAKAGVANTVNDAAQSNITSVGTLTSLSVSGNANIGNIGTGGLITATGTITGGNLATAGTLSAGANANVGNLGTNIITATGNITGSNIIGVIRPTAGTGTSGIIFPADPGGGSGDLATIQYYASSGEDTILELKVTNDANDSIYLNATGGTNVATSLRVAGTLSSTGNANVGNIGATSGIFTTVAGTLTTAAQPNITSTGTLTSLSVSGNANVGNLGTSQVLASANITAPQLISNIATGTAPLVVTSTTQVANLSVATAGTVTTAAQPNITSTGTLTSLSVTGNANVGNLYTTVISTGASSTAGNITGNWTLTSGSSLQATYADLAEYYEADQKYEPGTVLEFGGEKEVTLAQDGTTRVAGVVSTDPAYAMNAKCPGIAVAIALQGRVPVKVRGKIYKGDMLVSAGSGFARPTQSPIIGSVLGKALENFDGTEGIIEIAVGRL